MSTKLQTKLRTAKEAGLVSIMVTLILMIVISLIVLGFAQMSRRNQRQALDRQLSTQAFYAAETGVNDARDLIESAVAEGRSVPAKDDCGPGSGATALFYNSLTPVLDAASNVEYTCVMVDPAPENLLYGDVDSTSIVVPVISANGANISSVRLVWKTKESTNTPINNCPTTTNNVFSPNNNSWQCGYGVLRVDLVPTSGTFNAGTLQANTMTSFLVPLRSGGGNSIGFSANNANVNNRFGVRCTNTDCNLTITGLSTNQYYMRISSLYKPVSLDISARDGSGNPIGLQGAQAVIDATGKAQDVLRRIQVHVPLTPSSENRLSDYALQSTDSICKRFIVMDNLFDSNVNGVTSTNPLCQP